MMRRARTIGAVKSVSSLSKTAQAIAATFCFGLSIVTVQAQDLDGTIIQLPADIEYKGLPAAPQIATLFGDPSRAGMFVERMKIPAGYKIMPHYHPDTPRTVVVLSGTLYFALGEQWDETKFQAFPVGTFYTEYPKIAHYIWAKDGEVTLQVTSIGPTGTVPLRARTN